jgi:DNA-directed RNA polymerase II subunit RPB11
MLYHLERHAKCVAKRFSMWWQPPKRFKHRDLSSQTWSSCELESSAPRKYKNPLLHLSFSSLQSLTRLPLHLQDNLGYLIQETNASTMEEGHNGMGRDPYSHLNNSIHPVNQAVKDPSHPINRDPAARRPFTQSPAIHDGARNPAVHSNINIPDRFELFILAEGEKKITEAPDTRKFIYQPLFRCYISFKGSQIYLGTPNSSIFTVNKEDHTLGNLLRAHLLKDPHVLFAGYRGKFFSCSPSVACILISTVPHPLFASFELRVQTDGEITPKEALAACCKGIVSDLGQLSREFTKEFELRKMVGGEGSGNIADK